MYQKDAILTLLKENKKNQVWLSEKMGYSHPSGVGQMLQRGNITVDTLFQICELLDYEITIQPKSCLLYTSGIAVYPLCGQKHKTKRLFA